MATEHLLLGLMATDHEVAVWLREQGLHPDKLEAEIYELYGHAAQPLDIDWRGEAANDETCQVSQCAFEENHIDVEEPFEATSLNSHSVRKPAFNVSRQPDIAILRILDAAANRAREGLRVVEDYVRFVLDDAHLTSLCKLLRHDLTAVLSQLPAQERLTARETQADVGTTLTTDSERRREDVADLLAANFSRLQEAIRSLEEYSKLEESGKPTNMDLAAECKQLRYRVYTLQRAVEITRSSIERLANARLYVLIDGRSSFDEFGGLVDSLIEAGVHVIQLRDKRLNDRELLERAQLLRKLTTESNTLMVVNDRPDVAALARADGVHVGQEELSVKDARTIVGPNMLVGVSTHSIEQARQAVLDGANYIGVGPTFPSNTKSFQHFPGVDLLRVVAAEIRLPAFAIGGIHRNNLDQVLAAGFTRIAISGAITDAQNPASAARELLAALKRRKGAVQNSRPKVCL